LVLLTWIYLSLKKNTCLSKISESVNQSVKLAKARQYAILNPHISKSHIARITGLPKSSLYYKSSKEAKDLATRDLILETLKQDPFLGSKRMSDHLRVFQQITLNHKKISRVKRLFGIYVRYHRKNPYKRDVGLIDTQTLGISNLVKDLAPSHPNHIWSSDFTYLLFKSQWYYVATLKDNYTKEIVGWHLGKYHNLNLITTAFNKAVTVFGYPQYLHSDQGSEYRATTYLNQCKDLGIQISMSAKGHPWENGYQESYYNYFKLELGNINRFNTENELEYGIGRQIWYYNNFRIHSVIRTTPSLYRNQFRKNREGQEQEQEQRVRVKVEI
jgi:putative transposase